MRYTVVCLTNGTIQIFSETNKGKVNSLRKGSQVRKEIPTRRKGKTPQISAYKARKGQDKEEVRQTTVKDTKRGRNACKTKSKEARQLYLSKMSKKGRGLKRTRKPHHSSVSRKRTKI